MAATLALLVSGCGPKESVVCEPANSNNRSKCEKTTVAAGSADTAAIGGSVEQDVVQEPSEPQAASAVEKQSGEEMNALIEEKEEQMRRAREEALDTMNRANARADLERQNITDNFNRLDEELNALGPK